MHANVRLTLNRDGSVGHKIVWEIVFSSPSRRSITSASAPRNRIVA
jgi:hypothetical protein